MPDHKTVREHKYLRFFGTLLHDANLWHLNRSSVSGAFAVGLFSAFIPVPMQMILAAALAIPFRVNLPISVGLVWITNPFTMPPIFYFSYKVGTWILDTPVQHVEFALTSEWLASELGAIWEPFLLGCLICGMVSGLLGYVTMRIIWRLSVVRSWQERKNRRSLKQPD